MNVPIFLLQDMDGAKQYKRRLHILEIYANPTALTIKKGFVFIFSMIPYQKENYNYWQSGKKGINY